MDLKNLNEIVDSFRTICCESEVVRKGRANVRCKKCGGDSSMEFHFYIQAQT